MGPSVVTTTLCVLTAAALLFYTLVWVESFVGTKPPVAPAGGSSFREIPWYDTHDIQNLSPPSNAANKIEPSFARATADIPLRARGSFALRGHLTYPPPTGAAGAGEPVLFRYLTDGGVPASLAARLAARMAPCTQGETGFLAEDIYRAGRDAHTCSYTCQWATQEVKSDAIISNHTCTFVLVGTCVELAEEVVRTRIVRSSEVIGHERSCLIGPIGCVHRAIVSSVSHEEPVLAIRPLTVAQQELLIDALRVENTHARYAVQASTRALIASATSLDELPSKSPGVPAGT